MFEVDRPNRQVGRRTGKSDPGDALEAARAALSGRAQGAGKPGDGNVEAIRALVVAKRSARSTRIKPLNQIRHLGFTAPDELRERLRRPSLPPRRGGGGPATPDRWRPGDDGDQDGVPHPRTTGADPRRQLATIDALLAPLVTATAPSLLGLHSVGVVTAATSLFAAGGLSAPGP